MEAVEKKKKGSFSLPNKKVWIKPNKNNPGRIKDPRHVAYFKMEGTYDYFTVPMLRNSSNLANPLTDEEKDFLEKELTMEENGLSVYKKHDNFWRNYFLKLGKEPVQLDLSIPDDYIKYKVALVNKDFIAKNKKESIYSRSYKYYIEDAETEIIEHSKKAELNKTAWITYSKMENDKTKMSQFLLVFNEVFNIPRKKIADNVKVEFLQKEVTSIIEERMADFVDVITNDNYEYFVIIAEGIMTGVLEKKGTKYYLHGGKDKIGDTFEDTIQFLKMASNQDTKLLIEERIKKNK